MAQLVLFCQKPRTGGSAAEMGLCLPMAVLSELALFQRVHFPIGICRASGKRFGRGCRQNSPWMQSRGQDRASWAGFDGRPILWFATAICPPASTVEEGTRELGFEKCYVVEVIGETIATWIGTPLLWDASRALGVGRKGHLCLRPFAVNPKFGVPL